jgi:hypothetical protein
MNHANKKLDAIRKPGITANQRAIHRHILTESEQAKKAGGLVEAAAYPHLAALLKSAKLAAWNRRKLPARMRFTHEGKRYSAKFTSLGRVIVEKNGTGEVLAASAIFSV